MTNRDDTTDRREMLGLLALAGGGFGLPWPALAASTPEDFVDPVKRLDAFIKVEGDQSGAQVVQYGLGSVYTFVAGQQDRRLFDTEAFAVRRYRRIDGGWVRLHREVAVYRDVATGAIINRWYNPYLEREVEVFDIVQEFNRQYLVTELGKSFNVGIVAHGDDAFVHRNFFISREAEIQPKDYPLHGQDTRWELSEHHNYFSKLSDILNPDKPAAPCVGATNSVSSFLPWLEMGTAPGHLIFQMHSKKLTRVEDMSPDLVAYVQKNYPDFLEAPNEFKSSDVHTTGLNYYKAIIDRRRAVRRQ